MEKTSVTQQELITELAKSVHGKLSEYVTKGMEGASEHPEFYAHLIAYNERKGQIRDSKVAMPVITLATPSFPRELVENSLAHLALRSPRDLVTGYRFSKAVKTPGHGKALRRMVQRYLRLREADWKWFTRTALQHKGSLRELYALTHTERSIAVGAVLFGGEGSKRSGRTFTPTALAKGTVFNTVSNLKHMSPEEAAGHIMVNKIPFLAARGALGDMAKDPILVQALMSRMSPSELQTNARELEKLGASKIPALRAEMERLLERSTRSQKNTFKTTKAVEALEEDNPLREKLMKLQEQQLASVAGIDGDWLLLVDKSSSMQHAIELGRQLGATLAKMVRGKVHMVFFDQNAYKLDITGLDYTTILERTKQITAGGSTSIGVGLALAKDYKMEVDGILIVSDGAENRYPGFADTYRDYCNEITKRKIPVYLLMLQGTDNPMHIQTFLHNCKVVGAGPEIKDFTKGSIDYYSLPNIVASLRANRFSQIDEIMATPLLTLEKVLPVPVDLLLRG